MCPVADDNDGALAFKAVVQRARVPTVKLAANGLRARVRHRAEGVVDQRYVRFASVESAANADRVIAAALRRVPASARLAVFRELYVKHLRIFFRFHEIAHVAAEIFGERKARRRRNEVFVGMPAEIPRGEASRRQLAFAVSRRHQQHQPVDLTALDTFELFGNLPMQARSLVARESVLSEGEKACRRRPSLALAP